MISYLDGGLKGLFSIAARISRKIHMFPRAALATMTASQPVRVRILSASSAHATSPFPITGMDTACLTCTITSQFALPE